MDKCTECGYCNIEGVVVQESRIAELEAQIVRLEKAIQHCDPLCPAWAALEGEDGTKEV